MARLYWMKLKRDFFKRHDIQVIEAMPNGKDYVLFYLKLLCESLDHEGNLRFSDTIPYNEEMLSAITHTNVDTVRNAMNLFINLGLVEIFDDKTIYMSEVQKFIGSESESAERVRRHRALKEGKTVEALQCNGYVTECNESVTQSIDNRDKSIEYREERKKERNIKKTSTCARTRECEENEQESHADIMDRFGVTGQYREVLENYLRACYLNGHIVPNDVLRDLLSRLDKYYQDDDEAKALAIRKALNGGYYDIVELRDAPEVWR